MDEGIAAHAAGIGSIMDIVTLAQRDAGRDLASLGGETVGVSRFVNPDADLYGALRSGTLHGQARAFIAVT